MYAHVECVPVQVGVQIVGAIRQHTATHFNALQDTSTHCKTLERTARHLNTLQHIARMHTRAGVEGGALVLCDVVRPRRLEVGG